jgi:hypothetical protein
LRVVPNGRFFSILPVLRIQQQLSRISGRKSNVAPTTISDKVTPQGNHSTLPASTNSVVVIPTVNIEQKKNQQNGDPLAKSRIVRAAITLVKPTN